ncbi:MAG: hypothetical protein GY944_01830, partial [bacterium]|nr:hypothetical protein [bacterium]
MDSGSDSIYRPPESQLERPVDGLPGGGSVERALRGDVEFGIQEVITEAWGLVSGSKGVIFGLMAVAVVGTVVLSFVEVALFGIQEPGFGAGGLVRGVLSGLVTGAVFAPVNAAIYFYTIKRAAHDPDASFSTLSECFGSIVPILATFVLTTLFIYVGMALLLLPGIYLAVSYSFALPLVVEKRMGFWEAMETSRRSITQCWFRIFGLFVAVAFLAIFGSLFTLGIGLIWLLPFSMLTMGVAYRRMFGYEGASA